MIISASRRTDIPAFHSQWFINRIQEGFVIVNTHQNCGKLYRVPVDRCSRLYRIPNKESCSYVG